MLTLSLKSKKSLETRGIFWFSLHLAILCRTNHGLEESTVIVGPTIYSDNSKEIINMYGICLKDKIPEGYVVLTKEEIGYRINRINKKSQACSSVG